MVGRVYEIGLDTEGDIKAVFLKLRPMWAEDVVPELYEVEEYL